MTETPMEADHLAVYDRQIRLWGAESQRLLMESQVLFLGLSTCTLEAAKNIFLSGVPTALMDCRQISEDSIPTNLAQSCFITPALIRAAAVKKMSSETLTVADVAFLSLSELNPLGQMQVFASDAESALLRSGEDANITVLQSTALIVADANYPALAGQWQTIIDLDDRARRTEKGLIINFDFGMISGFWQNFHSHIVHDAVGPGADGVGHETSRKLRLENIQYQSLSQVAEGLFTFDKKPAHGARWSAADIFWKAVIWSMKENEPPSVFLKHYVNIEGRSHLCELLTSGTHPYIPGCSASERVEKLGQLVDEQQGTVFIPVASVVGGLLCNEMRKYVTKVQVPVDNAVLYSFFTCAYATRI